MEPELPMLTLFHHTMHAPSRFIRLSFGEFGEGIALIEEQPWSRRREFLQLNPAGSLPVLIAEGDHVVIGATVIAEYLDETRGALRRSKRLLAEDPFGRAEIRRLIDWFLTKMEAEVTRPLLRERIFRPQMPAELGGGSPDSGAIRSARANIRQHMKYLNWLAGSRKWLAGDELSSADLAAAATISALDYLGEVPWSDAPAARDWYARMKSRPSFRLVLQDRLRGHAPASHYTDLDF
jgi:glutathione S-transferase